ncbi:hypothetical protein J4Y38_23525 [Escherichia coli]
MTRTDLHRCYSPISFTVIRRSIFFADGTPRKIDFTLSLTRVDESLAALYGDIGKQAESLIGKAGSMATKFTGMTGAG